MKWTQSLLLSLCGAVLLLVSCTNSHDHAEPIPEAEPAPPTNRIDVPLSVRQNLGITFAMVERRTVANTIRYPGSFELKSTARHEYIAPAAGRIEILVKDYQEVEAGTPLFRIHSPAWMSVRASLDEALLMADAKKARIVAHEKHHEALQEKLSLWLIRLTQLEDLDESTGGQQALLSDARQNIAITDAEIADSKEKYQQFLLEALPYLGAEGSGISNMKFELALGEASILLGIDKEELSREVNGKPQWRTLESLEVKAINKGRIEPIPVASGSLVDRHAPIITVTDPAQLRFRAKALQSDLISINQGATARIESLTKEHGDNLEGIVSFGLEADPKQRTVDILIDFSDSTLPHWARPNVAAIGEVVVESGPRMELAIPERAIITDGLQRILFRRAPDNPNQVIRLEADTGISNGRWVEILSGLREGDEVVLGGIYELMLGSSTDGTRQEGGHFHADGTFHEAH